MRFLADTHSHTLASGHAYSTITEMAEAAAAKGLEVLALTEHAPKMPGTCGMFYFQNLDVVPRMQKGVRLLMGAEVNIMDPDGTIDLSEDTCRDLDIVVASIHPPCYGLGHPYVHIIGHPDDGRFPMDYEVLVRTAKETGTLLELNNSSLRPQSSRKGTRENMLTMLELCRQYEVPVTTGSDAHVNVDAGNFVNVREVIEYCGFPEELIATADLEMLKRFIPSLRNAV